MVDLETLDTKPGGIILSIGAVFFDRKTGMCPGNGMFYEELSIESQMVMGGTVSADTMDFWMRADPKWIEEVMGDAYQAKLPSAQTVLERLNAWCSKFFLSSEKFNLDRVWAQGDMDLSMVAELYRRVANHAEDPRGFGTGAMPWPYYLHRDTRTAYDIAGFDPKTMERTGRHHHALDDALHQVKCLLRAVQPIQRPIQRPFNGLSPAEAERLAMLSEEAGEIVQIVGKILRHGYESYHPDDPRRIPNRALLMNELADLNGVQLFMEGSRDIFRTGDEVQHAMERKMTYTHHQEKS
jgi:hypothetical protein